jgi:hypothetical protein
MKFKDGIKILRPEGRIAPPRPAAHLEAYRILNDVVLPAVARHGIAAPPVEMNRAWT